MSLVKKKKKTTNILYVNTIYDLYLFLVQVFILNLTEPRKACSPPSLIQHYFLHLGICVFCQVIGVTPLISWDHYWGLQTITFTSCGVIQHLMHLNQVFLAWSACFKMLSSECFYRGDISNFWGCSLLIVATRTLQCSWRGADAGDRYQAERGRPWGGSIMFLKPCSQFRRGEFSLISSMLLFMRPGGAALFAFFSAYLKFQHFCWEEQEKNMKKKALNDADSSNF